MKPEHQEPEDVKLRGLLRDSRPAPSLPPRFQEAVWRRIERLDAARANAISDWIEGFAARLVRPRLAFATLVTFLLLGGITGVVSGLSATKQSAQDRYLASVAPNALR